MLFRATVLFYLAAACAGRPRAQTPASDRDLQLATRFLEAGNPEEAERLLRRVVTADPDSFAAWFQLGLALHGRGRNDDALHAAETALQLVPDHAQCLLLAAELQVHSAPDTARIRARQAAELRAHDVTHQQRVVAVLTRLGDLEAAERALLLTREARSAEGLGAELPDELLWRHAELDLARGRLEAATQAYRALAERNPRDPQALESLANALMLSERRGEAIAAYHATLEVRPSSVQARARLIELMLKAGAPAQDVELERRYLAHYRALHARWKDLGIGPYAPDAAAGLRASPPSNAPTPPGGR